MKFQWKKLLVVLCLYYVLIFGFLEPVLRGHQISNIFSEYEVSLFFMSSITAFFLFGIGIYTVFFYFYATKKWLLLVVSTILVFIFSIAFRAFVEEFLYVHLFGVSNYADNVNVSFYIRDNLLYGFRFAFVGLVFFFVTYTFNKQKEQTQLELINKDNQLEMLKSQLNPHFLLNSLNNIYSLVYQKSDKALPALDNLGEVLKYGLYETNDFVLLEKELNYVNKYIELNQVRIEQPIHFVSVVHPRLLSNMIPHFLFIPLFENCFNYGDLSHPIELEISSVNKKLMITLTNTIGRTTFNKEEGGIGLKNIKQRLALLYGNEACLTTNATKLCFNVNIQLPI